MEEKYTQIINIVGSLEVEQECFGKTEEEATNEACGNRVASKGRVSQGEKAGDLYSVSEVTLTYPPMQITAV